MHKCALEASGVQLCLLFLSHPPGDIVRMPGVRSIYLKCVTQEKISTTKGRIVFHWRNVYASDFLYHVDVKWAEQTSLRLLSSDCYLDLVLI